MAKAGVFLLINPDINVGVNQKVLVGFSHDLCHNIFGE
jgi:hypothetical protein